MENTLIQIETKKKLKDLSAGLGTTFHDLNNCKRVAQWITSK